MVSKACYEQLENVHKVWETELQDMQDERDKTQNQADFEEWKQKLGQHSANEPTKPIKVDWNATHFSSESNPEAYTEICKAVQELPKTLRTKPPPGAPNTVRILKTNLGCALVVSMDQRATGETKILPRAWNRK